MLVSLVNDTIFGFEGRVGMCSGAASIHCKQVLFECVLKVIPLRSEFLYFVGEYNQNVVELFFIAAVTVNSLQELLDIFFHVAYELYDSGFVLRYFFVIAGFATRPICSVVDVLLEVHANL
jgi:hypothetical protein